ncbi:MAG: helix-turn-helix transcriptional regulator [Endozoicomonas sp.]
MSPKEAEIIQLAFAAIETPEHWRDLLIAMGKAAGACCGYVASIDLRNKEFIGFMRYGSWETNQARGIDQALLIECGLKVNGRKAGPGKPSLFTLLDRKDELRELFNSSSALSCDLFTAHGEVLTKVVLMRCGGEPAFDESDLRPLNELLPYLYQAHQVAFDHHKILTENWNYQTLAEYAHEAIILLDENQRVIVNNKSADRLLKASGLATVQPGETFKFSHIEQQSLLVETVRHLLSDGGQCINEDGSHFYLTRKNQNYRILVKPWISRKMTPLREVESPGIQLIIQPCATRMEFTPNDITQSFPLSGAESDVCCRICNGYSTEDISRMRNTSLGTTRQQVKACLAKTESVDKTEMIGKVLRALLIA